jgi:hypothetical protein
MNRDLLDVVNEVKQLALLFAKRAQEKTAHAMTSLAVQREADV